jgi:hypothetical protein
MTIHLFHHIARFALFALSLHAAAAEKGGSAVLSIAGERWLMNGLPFKPWGIRVASAVNDAESTQQLLAQLDDYRAQGLNSLAVFYQGSSGGYSNPFSPDGKTIDAAVQSRMVEIIRAAEARQMMVIVGIFYARSPFPFRDREAVRHVLRTVTESLRPYSNIVINIANEHNNPRFAPTADICDFRETNVIIELCRLVKELHPQRLVGGGGYDHTKNEIIGRSPYVDVLLFDTFGASPDSGALCDRFQAAGVTNKPIVNVEIFGAWTLKFLPPGVFSDEVKAAHFGEIEAAARRPALSVFLHNSPWVQGPDQKFPRRYDLGGDGTAASPGLRWYFQRIQKTQTSTQTTPSP